MNDDHHLDVVAAPPNPTVVKEEEENGENDGIIKRPKTKQAQRATASVLSSTMAETRLVSSSKTTSSSHRFKNNRIVVFSDVDGTLVHYPSSSSTTTTTTNNDSLLYLPPSMTGSRGVISSKTLVLCHQLRHGSMFKNAEDYVEKLFGKKLDHDNDDDDDDIANNDVEGDDTDDDARDVVPVVVPLVLISGMRTSTLFKRMPYLPRSDAYVCESGGRIFYPRPFMIRKDIHNYNTNDNNVIAGAYDGKDHLIVRPVAYPGMPSGYDKPFILEEDMYWRERMTNLDAAGPDGYDDDIQIEYRRGKLWDFARTLIFNDDDVCKNDDSVIDADGYATAFRIRYRQKSRRGDSDMPLSPLPSSLLPPLPDGLACSTNLGCVDIYPAMSGKRNCAEYLAQKFLGQAGERNEVTPCSSRSRSSSSNNNSNKNNNGENGKSLLKTNAYCLCDDDNDIEMALACRAAYLPSVTSESMRSLATSEENSLIVTADETNGIVESIATEAALRALMEELQLICE